MDLEVKQVKVIWPPIPTALDWFPATMNVMDAVFKAVNKERERLG